MWGLEISKALNGPLCLHEYCGLKAGQNKPFMIRWSLVSKKNKIKNSVIPLFLFFILKTNISISMGTST